MPIHTKYLCTLPLLLALTACEDRSTTSPSPPSSTTAPAGMSKFPYLAADGGPHLLLPAEASSAWTAPSSMLGVLNPKSDYGRACAAVSSSPHASIPVASTTALVFADPPMSSFGKSADGLAEIYILNAWNNTDLDTLLTTASAALPTTSFKPTGMTLRLTQPDAFLLFAGDTPASSTYGVIRIPLPANTYTILTATYTAPKESVTLFRLQPSAPATTSTSKPATQPRVTMTLETKSFLVTLTDDCEEGNVSCSDIRYHGVAKKNGASLNLIGSTWHKPAADGSPGRFVGYRFENGDTTYLIIEDEKPRLAVVRKNKTLLEEEGTWKDEEIK